MRSKIKIYLFRFLDLLINRHVGVGLTEFVLQFLAVFEIFADIRNVAHVFLLAHHAVDGVDFRLKVIHV